MKNDEQYMLRAIEVGEQARRHSSPNPWVGCVLVKNDHIIAEGFTQPPGHAHAEIMALGKAKGEANGSIAYVTLEPCAHFGRTPPCTAALIKAKVKRVVIATEDPDPLVQGRGIAELRRAGVDVTCGVCSEAARLSLRSYLHHRKTGKAYCLIKMAVSIDGRVAAKDKTSQWISSEEARVDAHTLRAKSQAIMIGSGTALADNPALTVRNIPLVVPPPLRVLCDRKGIVPGKGPLFDQTLAPTLVITSNKCLASRQLEWAECGAQILFFDEAASFEKILSHLGAKGIIQVLVEGGPSLQSELIRQRVCQEVVVYTGALILGDEGISAFRELGVSTISEGLRLSLHTTKSLGSTIRSDYFITSET